MSITIEVNGTNYTNFTNAQVSIRLDALSNTFNFSAVSTDGQPLPFAGGQSCKIFVDGELVLTGFLEIITVDYDSTGHSINLSGRDKTGDLLDSTLDNLKDFRAPITLTEIINNVINSLGLDIKVKENTSTRPFNAAEDLISPQPGKKAIALLETYSRKRNVLLTSDGNGDIVITQSSGVAINATLQNIIASNENNILNASVSYDTTGRFNKYKFASNLNPIALNLAGSLDLADLVDQSGGIQDDEIRTGRQLVLIAESPFSDGQNENRAKWEANVRRARGRVYSAEIQGYRNTTGNLWTINKLIKVRDDFAGINDEMLINSVTYKLSVNSGSTTVLSLVDKDAYTLELAKPQRTKTTTGLGLGLTKQT